MDKHSLPKISAQGLRDMFLPAPKVPYVKQDSKASHNSTPRSVLDAPELTPVLIHSSGTYRRDIPKPARARRGYRKSKRAA